ncbi:MAG: DUF975 family protein [Clostridia bacterium]|nr:DUF975 family protein [Clostridia bacterium]
MTAKNIRDIAWEKLDGYWGKMALIAFVHVLIVGAVTSVKYVGDLVSLVLTGPFSLSLAMIALAVLKGQEFSLANLFDGFRSFAKAFSLYIINEIFIFLWSLLFIIPGIIKAFSYSMSFYILAENPQMSPSEARKESMRMMDGHKWRLFCLEFSFFGWIMLSVITCGILFLWVAPYMQTSMAAFYQNLKENDPNYRVYTPIGDNTDSGVEVIIEDN